MDNYLPPNASNRVRRVRPKRSWKKPLLIAMLALAITAAVLGIILIPRGGEGPSVYYFAATGNDENPGSEEKPFKTLEKASELMKEGKTLLFRRGDSFYTGVGRFTLADIDGGEAGVILSDYGDPDKDKPEFTSFVDLTDWREEGAQSHVWSCAIGEILLSDTDAAAQVLMNDLPLTSVSDLGSLNEAYFYTDGERLYVFSMITPNEVRLLTRESSVTFELENVKGLTAENISFTGGTEAAVSVIAPSVNLRLYYCDFSSLEGTALLFTGDSNRTEMEHEAPYIYTCFFSNSDTGLCIKDTAENTRVSESVFTGCGTAVRLAGAGGFGGVNGTVADGCRVYGSGEAARGLYIDGGIATRRTTVRRCLFEDTVDGSYIDAADTLVYSSVFRNSLEALAANGGGDALGLVSPDGVVACGVFINNSFINSAASAIHVTSNADGAISSAILTNNLFSGWGYRSREYCVEVENTLDSPTMVMNNNLFSGQNDSSSASALHTGADISTSGLIYKGALTGGFLGAEPGHFSAAEGAGLAVGYMADSSFSDFTGLPYEEGSFDIGALRSAVRPTAADLIAAADTLGYSGMLSGVGSDGAALETVSRAIARACGEDYNGSLVSQLSCDCSSPYCAGNHTGKARVIDALAIACAYLGDDGNISDDCADALLEGVEGSKTLSPSLRRAAARMILAEYYLPGREGEGLFDVAGMNMLSRLTYGIITRTKG